MGLEISWRSEQGTLTSDNRDFCGAGLRDDAALCVVLDGSTSGPNSGEFAGSIAQALIDWFVEAGKVSADAIIDRLHNIHDHLSSGFRTDSASFVCALIEEEERVRLIHSGDCRAGLRTGMSGIKWRTRPHTLANAIEDVPICEIALSPLRNRLTRSFRGREFMAPEVSELRLEGDQELVLATDGFWAALAPEDQARFLTGEAIPALMM
jgi:PPM family protein phosphatase